MNVRVLFCMMALWLSATMVFAVRRDVRGNGQAVTKRIPISDYNAVSLVGSVEFEYSQSNTPSSLELTIDENLLPFLEIKVVGKTLNIHPTDECMSFSPTVFKIRSNSRALKECSMAGSGSFRVVTPLTVDKTFLSLAGSGSIVMDKRVAGYKLECNVAGSGEISVKNAAMEALECSVAGSGEIYVKGAVPRAVYSVAGSGEIRGYDCKVTKAECSVAGSGNIEVYALSELDASIAASGDIHYRGNPRVSESVVGSGSIRKD